ncbi:MAG: hypothetical protein S4CHLAM6_09490 [Chlamydiae bacterium]|nr:hypothetical protein [Chlamydiota bacterium]
MSRVSGRAMRYIFYITLFSFLNLGADPQAPPTATYGNCKGLSTTPTYLKIIESKITVQGKESNVYGLIYNDDQNVIRKTKGDCFNLVIKNETSVPTSIHWHGFVLPNVEDGVAYITQPPIFPGQLYPYNFKVVQEGTYFAHSHYGLQEQKLMAIPLIAQSPDEPKYKNKILCLESFSFKEPEKIWQGLRKNFMEASKEVTLQTKSSLLPTKPTLNDVYYDAFLCNHKTLEDPDVWIVEPGEIVRLRFINASASSGFHIDLGELSGSLIAVDGNNIQPIDLKTFPIATAQRADILVRIPNDGGVFPVIAQCQGTQMLTGAILKTKNEPTPKMSSMATQTVGAISNQFEKKLHAIDPLLPKKIDRTLNVSLDGNMAYYVWGMNGHSWPNYQPLIVKEGERVEIVFTNNTPMAHPMHLHGHIFQVTEINGDPINEGAMRDVLLVMPHQSAKIVFDANNPGFWAFHCHMLYHSWGGLMTVIQYEGVDSPTFNSEALFYYSSSYGARENNPLMFK